MKLAEVLSEVNELIKHLRAGRKKRLYTQRVEMVGLPPEAVPHNNGRNGIVKVERIITINAPVEKVFAYISDPANDKELIPGITDVRDIIGQGVGQRYCWTYKIMGLPLKGEAFVAEHSQNQRRVERTTSGFLSMWTWTFKRKAGRTMLKLTVEYTVPVSVFDGVSEKLVKMQNEREADLASANIKTRMEDYTQASIYTKTLKKEPF